LLGFGLGQLFGLDIFANGYSNSVIGGIVLVGLGGGLALQGGSGHREGTIRIHGRGR
jgi:hypothetical protein